MRLVQIQKITGVIHCETNLHIGGSKDDIEIGGMDNPIIRHPLTGEPYIPGSSLKGVMRCSMERLMGINNICKCKRSTCYICRIFGTFKNPGPTRLIVRDAPLTPDCRQEYLQFIAEQNQPYIGVKYENMIDRNTGAARFPRSNEFVPAGARFALELALQVYDSDDPDNDFGFLRRALRLVSERYIGGYGSRGYGKVHFEDLQRDGIPFTLDDVKVF